MERSNHKTKLTNRQILVFTDKFYPKSAGREIHMYEIYRRMAKDGWKVNIFTSKNTHTELNVLPDHEVNNMINIYRFNSYRLGLWILGINFNNAIISIHGLQHFPDLFILNYIYILKKLFKKDIHLIFTSHGMYSYRYKLAKNYMSKFKLFLETMITKHILMHVVDRWLSVSKWEKKYMKKSGIKNISVIYNGISLDSYLKKEKSSHTKNDNIPSKYIIQIGRIDGVKNYETVIRALPLLSDDIHFIIIGPIKYTPYQRFLDKMVEDLKLVGRVHFIGEVTGSKKYSLLKNAISYVQLSTTEGFGITVLEAMSQGTPCIVSKGTALEELVENGVNGYVVPMFSSNQLAEKVKLLSLKKDKSLNKRINLNNKNKANEYSWDNITSVVEEIYAQV